MNDWAFFGYFLLAVAAGFVIYDMATVWAALRVHAQSGDWLMAVGGTDDDEDDVPLYPKMPPIPADGDDYAYPQREERLVTGYDVRTYPERADERMAALEEAIRKLERRITALEGR